MLFHFPLLVFSIYYWLYLYFHFFNIILIVWWFIWLFFKTYSTAGCIYWYNYEKKVYFMLFCFIVVLGPFCWLEKIMSILEYDLKQIFCCIQLMHIEIRCSYWILCLTWNKINHKATLLLYELLRLIAHYHLI